MVKREMGLPGLTARGIELLVKVLAAPALRIGDDIAGVTVTGTDINARNHATGFLP
ncbi:hypothetical protein ABIE69_003581 [Rhodobacteraceae bacterium MBR-64]